MMRQLQWTAFTVAGGLLVGSAVFQGAAVGQSSEDVSLAQEKIEIFVRQSKILTPREPVRRVSVTDPNIADAEVISPRQVMVLARKIGTTDVLMWGENDERRQVKIDVRVDLKRLEGELATLFPDSKLEVHQSQDVIAITGDVAGPEQEEQLKKFLESCEKATGLQHVFVSKGENGGRVTARPGTGTTQRPAQPLEEEGVEDDLDPAKLQAELKRLFPGCDLEVMKAQQGVFVIKGLLTRVEQAQQLDMYLKAVEANFIARAEANMGGQTIQGKPSGSAAGAAYGTGRVTPQRVAAKPGFKFVNLTSVAGVQQVLIQVRVAEVTRQALRSLGINAIYGPTQDNTFWGFSQVGNSRGGTLNPTTFEKLGNPHNPSLFQINTTTTISPLNTMLLDFPRADLLLLLQALAENEYLRVLAEPNLVALSGEEASFLAGGEFPIPVVQGGTSQAGGTSITIEYKEFGVRLRFRPTVLGDNTIRLHVGPEVSELSDRGAVEIQGFRVPSLISRRAETTLELKSGQTFMMAGLLSERDEGLKDAVPELGSVPVLGALFRSMRYVRGETELAVMVSAWLVEPMSVANAPPLPGITDVAPSDWELYAMGSIEGSEAPKLSQSDAAWLRQIGFTDLKGMGAWATHEQGTAQGQGSMRPAAGAVK